MRSSPPCFSDIYLRYKAPFFVGSRFSTQRKNREEPPLFNGTIDMCILHENLTSEFAEPHLYGIALLRVSADEPEIPRPQDPPYLINSVCLIDEDLSEQQGVPMEMAGYGGGGPDPYNLTHGDGALRGGRVIYNAEKDCQEANRTIYGADLWCIMPIQGGDKLCFFVRMPHYQVCVCI